MIGLRVRAKPTAPSSTPRKPIAAGDHNRMLAEPRPAAPAGMTRKEAERGGAVAGAVGTEGRSTRVVGRATASAARTSSCVVSGARTVAGAACGARSTVPWRDAPGDDTAWVLRTLPRPAAAARGCVAGRAWATVAATRSPVAGVTGGGAATTAGAGSSAEAGFAAGATGAAGGGELSTTSGWDVATGCGCDAGTGAAGGADAAAGGAGALTGRNRSGSR
jgi:hypothetical protein